MNLLRWIASLPGLRRVLLRPRVRRFLATLLAVRFALVSRRTTTPWTLLWNEYVAARGRVRRYTVRGTGVPVLIQHGRDLETLFEVFERGEYEPPEQLADRLAPGRVRRVLDVGANVGLFSAWAAGRFPDARITAFEPAADSVPIYRSWLRASGADAELVEAAATTAAGSLGFVDGLGSGSAAGSAQQATREVAAVDLFEHLPAADLVKIDIEGGEWAILTDPRLADLHGLTLVMEYHRHRAPALPAGDAARDLLVAAGFTVRMAARNYWGHGTLWAWKD